VAGGLAAGRGALGGRGVAEEEPFLSGSWSRPRHLSGGSGGTHTALHAGLATKPVLPPHLPFPPLVELFLLPLLHRSLFSLPSTTSPRAAAVHNHPRGHIYNHSHRDKTICTSFTRRRRAQPWDLGPTSPIISLAAAAHTASSLLLRGHQTLTSLHPIRHGPRPAATTRPRGHHNASQSPAPPRFDASIEPASDLDLLEATRLRDHQPCSTFFPGGATTSNSLSALPNHQRHGTRQLPRDSRGSQNTDPHRPPGPLQAQAGAVPARARDRR
jgi:hypothetical protein